MKRRNIFFFCEVNVDRCTKRRKRRHSAILRELFFYEGVLPLPIVFDIINVVLDFAGLYVNGFEGGEKVEPAGIGFVADHHMRLIVEKQNVIFSLLEVGVMDRAIHLEVGDSTREGSEGYVY